MSSLFDTTAHVGLDSDRSVFFCQSCDRTEPLRMGTPVEMGLQADIFADRHARCADVMFAPAAGGSESWCYRCCRPAPVMGSVVRRFKFHELAGDICLGSGQPVPAPTPTAMRGAA